LKPSSEQPVVELRQVSKSYGAGNGVVAALRDASLSINAGEFVAVVGRSGSGKSTLMNLIGLLDSPSSGTLFVCGVQVNGLAADALARLRNRHIGFVFQAYHLMPRRTTLANVALPLIYQGIGGGERVRLACKALEDVGLGHRASALPTQLSGGEQQRIAFARALVTRPELIIADEPTGALDTASSELVLELLEAANAAGRTVVMVTHDPAVAARAGRQVRLSDGRVTSDDGSRSAFPEAA
jgi:putative ABC transport system ATP-binding protein